MTLMVMTGADLRRCLLGFICFDSLDQRYQRSMLLGVPLAKPRVGLSAPSPRADYRTPGFPLLSLTRSTR